MNWVLAILGTVGLYFLLGMWAGLKGSVAFVALGMSITWFAILFLIGTFLVLRATVFSS